MANTVGPGGKSGSSGSSGGSSSGGSSSGGSSSGGSSYEPYSSPLWNSGLPFVNQDNKSVDWVDVGLSGVAIAATSFFDSVASTIGTTFNALIIEPANQIASESSNLVNLLVSNELLSFQPALQFVQDTGLIGSVAVLVAGYFVLSLIGNALGVT